MAASKVPPIADVAAKFARRAQSAGPEYESGVRNPATPWAAASQAAQGSYEAGVTAAISRKAYGKGVGAAGDSRWSRGAIEKGPARYAQGVQLAEGDYAARMAPVLDTIARIDLPARGPRGSAQNLARMTPIPQALAALKRK
jgi:hypothetical protein